MSDQEGEQRSRSGSADEPTALAATTNPDGESAGREDDENSHGDAQDALEASSASTSRLVDADNAGGDENDDEDAETTSISKQNVEDVRDLIASNDVKNIILQITSPYLDDNGGLDDDEGGDGDGDRLGEDGADSGAQRYDHMKSKMWIQLICDGIVERLVALGKPYKFIVHCMIMRKNGAGMHVCSSCLYGHSDGWVNHAHDLSTHIYAIVTVYWSSI